MKVAEYIAYQRGHASPEPHGRQGPEYSESAMPAIRIPACVLYCKYYCKEEAIRASAEAPQFIVWGGPQLLHLVWHFMAVIHDSSVLQTSMSY